MNVKNIIHDGRVNTNCWIMHKTEFSELDTVTCDDCIYKCQVTIDANELFSNARIEKMDAIIRDCDGIDELPAGATICELAHTREGAYLYLIQVNDYGDIWAVIEGESGSYIAYESVDESIMAFFGIDPD